MHPVAFENLQKYSGVIPRTSLQEGCYRTYAQPGHKSAAHS